MARDVQACPIHGNGSDSSLRAWGGLGRRLAGLCQAESYLLQGKGSQDSRPPPPRHRPRWTERDWDTLLMPGSSTPLSCSRLFAEEFGKMPLWTVRSPESPFGKLFPNYCDKLEPVRKGLGCLTLADQLKTPQDLYLMVLRGHRDSCALPTSGLLNKGNKIWDVLTSLSVVLKILCVWGFLKMPHKPRSDPLGGVGLGSCLDWQIGSSSIVLSTGQIHGTHPGLTPKKPQLTP